MPNIHDFEPLWGEWYTTETLGRGSFGEVYLAEKKELGKTYHSAIKFITIPSDDAQAAALFEEGLVKDSASLKAYYNQLLRALMTEIEVNYSLKGNTNIVSYEAHKIIQRTDKPGYIIIIKMELLSSLNAFIRSRPLTLLDVIKLGEDICTALNVLQRRRVVHRDIKPSNIFINDIGDFKLGDFGVARSMEKAINTMSIKGTFTFMPPEVARGDDGDYRVDIYSLGLVLYRLLNGNRSPFLPPPPARISYDENLQAQKKRLQGKDMPAPAFADKRLAKIILKACAYNPEDRWESAYEMKQQLMDYRYALSGTDTAQQVLLDYSGMEMEPTTSRSNYSLEEDYLGDGEQTVMLSLDEDATMVLLTEESTGRQFLKLRKDNQDKPVYTGGVQKQKAADVQKNPRKRAKHTWGFGRKKPLADKQTPVAAAPKPEGVAAKEPPAERVKHSGKSEAKKPIVAGVQKPQATAQQQESPAIIQDMPEKRTKRTWKLLNKKRFTQGIAIVTIVLLLINLFSLFFSDTPMADEPSNNSPTTANRPTGNTEPPDQPESEVEWQDEAFVMLVSQVFDKEIAEITADDLLGIEKLEFIDQKINSLADLVHFSSLKILTLEAQKVDDLSPLLQLPLLDELSLRNCELTDVAVLDQLTSLRKLDLSNNHLTSLDFVTGLSNLLYLDVANNDITSLEPVQALDQLNVLVADNNPVDDWQVVAQIAYVSGQPQEEESVPVNAEQPSGDTGSGDTQPDNAAQPDTSSTTSSGNSGSSDNSGSTSNTPEPAGNNTAATQEAPVSTPQPTPNPAQNNDSGTTAIAVTGVTISRGSAILDTGTSIRLTAQVAPENATNQTLSWSSSNTAVATVYNGTVTAKTPGTAVITVTCGGFRASCAINVN